jgi:hypothetical protein
LDACIDDNTGGVAHARRRLLEASHQPSARLTAARWWVLPLAIYAFSRILGAVILLLSTDDQVVVLPGGGQAEPGSGGYGTAVTNWDGQWYARIAAQGYPGELPRDGLGAVQQNPWAFYPLFPAISRVVMELTRLPFTVAAPAVSMLAGAGAAVLLYRMVRARADRFSAAMTVLALCLSPAAPVLQAAFSESLALLLVLGCLWTLGHREYGRLAALAVVLSLARAVVLPLAAVIVVHGIARWWVRRQEPFPARERWRCGGAAAVAALSFGLWPAITALVTGEPNGYFLSQQAWFTGGSASTSSWLGHLASPGGRAPGVVAVAALVVLVVMVTRRGAHPWGVELRAWAVAYPLYILVATRPLAGIIRYALLAVIPFWPGPRAPAAAPLDRGTRLLAIAAVVALGTAGQWWWVRHVFVATPSGDLFP